MLDPLVYIIDGTFIDTHDCVIMVSLVIYEDIIIEGCDVNPVILLNCKLI